MTSNQINYFKAQEEARHNRFAEMQGFQANMINLYNAHTQRRKAANDYEIGMTTAMANQRNAETNYQNALINLKNAETRVYEAEIARMNAETNKQNADTRLLELDETRRHNLANEDVAVMSATETQRHNQEMESLGFGELAESSRHNQSVESIDLARVNETNRHNKISELTEQRSANIRENQYLSNVIIEKNKLAETQRHNERTERLQLADMIGFKPLEKILGIVPALMG